MIEELKKALLAGLGATVATKDKVECIFNELVEKGKITADEAKDMTERLSQESKEEFESAKSRLQESIESMLSKANFASQKQVDELEKRLSALEKKISNKK
ncbi:MAG: hypothetical protein Tsb0018_07000 [Opitutales bacterium]|tara:strand:- start:2068 stop:2370 length:303 start_codon:yes stop_codon:yes gene_type:complete